MMACHTDLVGTENFMKVVRVDLLEREITPCGRCIGKARICLSTGENIVVDCAFPFTGVGGLHGLNSIFARAAIRQLKRLPEFAGTSLEIAKHAMPRAMEWA